MAKCQKCESARIIDVNAKCSDMCVVEIGGKERNGYVPTDVVFGKGGWGDYVGFSLCLDCGQMQGEWPNPPMELESVEDES